MGFVNNIVHVDACNEAGTQTPEAEEVRDAAVTVALTVCDERAALVCASCGTLTTTVEEVVDYGEEVLVDVAVVVVDAVAREYDIGACRSNSARRSPVECSDGAAVREAIVCDVGTALREHAVPNVCQQHIAAVHCSCSDAWQTWPRTKLDDEGIGTHKGCWVRGNKGCECTCRRPQRKTVLGCTGFMRHKKGCCGDTTPTQAESHHNSVVILMCSLHAVVKKERRNKKEKEMHPQLV